MDQERYDILFRGRLALGVDPERVRERFARVFGLSGERLDAVFSGRAVALKRNVGAADAERYLEVLRQAGIEAERAQVAVPADAPVAVAEAATEAPTAATQATVRRPPPGQDQPQRLTFEFTGQGGEFFRIWIVNILLTVLTLGIYSAWAKVRTNRYFYGNTRLDDAAFEYLAEPLQILKGRLLALVLFAVYTITNQVLPILGLVLSLLFLAVMPWLITRALAFRARMSAYRNVRFGFTGTTREAATAFLLLPLAGVLTLGILMPYAVFRQQQFIVSRSRYGEADFEFDTTAGGYYRLFGIVIGVLLAAGVAAAVLTPLLPPLAPLLMLAAYLLAFAWFNVGMVNLRYGGAVIDRRFGFEPDYRVGSYLRLMLGNILGMVLTLGLFYPWAKVRNARYAAGHIAFIADGELDGFANDQQSVVSAVGQEVGDVFDIQFGV